MFLDEYKKWLDSDMLSASEKEELKSIANDEKEIESRFYTDLSFGTAGMRGIRGIGRNRMNKYNIRKATQGLANYIIKETGEVGKKKGVAIAYDSRLDSVENAINTAMTLAGNGIKVYLFDGVRSTPELSFAVRELKAQAGIMITASHNPKEYNGYKVYWEDGAQIVDPQATGIVSSVTAVDIFTGIKIMEEKEAIDKGLLVYVGKKLDDRYIEEVKKNAINPNVENKDKIKFVYSPLHGVAARPVERVLKEMGYTIIDADKLGHVALTSNDVKRKLAEKFGDGIIENNEISREKLGKLVFGNDENLKILNSIIHPKIKELILKLQDDHKDEDLVFLDIALLYEANFVDLVEKVAVVYVDKDVQLERLMTRNSLSKEEALKRIESQMSPQEKASLGDFVINNSYRKEDTFQQIDEILEKLKRGDKHND